MQVFVLPVAQIPWRIWVEFFFTMWTAVGLTRSWCSDGSMDMTGHLNRCDDPSPQVCKLFLHFTDTSTALHCVLNRSSLCTVNILCLRYAKLLQSYRWGITRLLPVERIIITLFATKTSLSCILPDAFSVWVPFKGFCVGLSPPPPIYQKINACWQLSATATSVFLTAFPVCPARRSGWDNGYSCRD